jgi:hypothetical protein
MRLKRLLYPFAVGALALSLAACGEEDTAAKTETPQGETAQEGATDEKAAGEMQAKLAKQQVDKSEIVAVINKEELTGEEYNAALASLQVQMQQMGQDPSSKEAAAQVKEQTLNMLVGQTLLLQKAKEANLTASKKEIDERYATFEEQFGGKEEMSKALEIQSMDIKSLKEQIEQTIIFEKYQNKVVPVNEISDKEIQAYYDQAAAQAKESEQGLPPLEEASEEIKGLLAQQQQQEMLAEHIEELKAKAEIELKI